MGDRLLQLIKQTGIFMVCAQMILHFKPAECYEKYIRLLIGIMVLAQFITAGTAVFGKGGENFFDGRVDYYEELFTQSMEGADMEELETLLEKMTMEEVQAQIDRMKEEQKRVLQQNGAGAQQEPEAQQSEKALESGEEQQKADVQQTEEIGIQIDRIEVNTGG